MGSNPGEDEESGIINDKVKVCGPLFAGPTDKAVTRGNFPCGSAKSKGGEKVPGGREDEISDLSAREWFVTEIMITFDQFIPEGGILTGGYRLKEEFAKFTGW